MTGRRKQPPPLRGQVRVPGDKSISHRALVLAALAPGRSTVRGANSGDDVAATAAALGRLGAPCTTLHNDSVEVEGCGWDGLREPDDVLDLRNSGTGLRLLLGVSAGGPGVAVLTGDESLRRRPMLRAVAPLRQMGARIDGRRHGELAPLLVRGGALTAADIEIAVASAQVKSAILLAGLWAVGRTSVTEPHRSRDHLERMLAASGVPVEVNGATVTVAGGSDLPAIDRAVPGDVSSAMFLVAAATVIPGSELSLVDVGLNPSRRGALDVLMDMGASVDVELTGEESGEPLGSVRVRSASLRGTEVDPSRVPALIDEIPILAVAASQAEGPTIITGASELRVKESDRIEAIVEGLRALGADADPLPDGLVVTGPTRLSGGQVQSHGDHRIALAFAVAGLVADANVRIEGWSCVDTSFPEFLDVLAMVQKR